MNTIHQEGKLPKMNLVLNGVDLQQRKYGYYYGYGNYGRYGRYGSYGSYGGYGNYGGYGKETHTGKSKSRHGSSHYLREDHFDDKD